MKDLTKRILKLSTVNWMLMIVIALLCIEFYGWWLFIIISLFSISEEITKVINSLKRKF